MEYKCRFQGKPKITFSFSGCDIKAKFVPAKELIIQANDAYKNIKINDIKKTVFVQFKSENAAHVDLH